MAKDRKEIENDILIEEMIGEEEDYEEYARLREEREGIRARRTRIEQEEERRQTGEYERKKEQEAEEKRIREEKKRLRAYEKRKTNKKHPVRNFFLILLVLLFVYSHFFLYL